VDLVTLVESVATSHSVAADSKAILVRSVFDTSAGPVLGDPNRLRQVISNLFSNAVKFTPKGGDIYLGLARIGSNVEFVIRDSGVGLTQQALERVFEAFWQVDSSAGRTERGLGLGLSIAKHLVELHGGSISAESSGLNQGTTFRVRLPVASTLQEFEGEALAPTASAPRAEKALRGVRALVVEDEEDSRRLIRHILERAGASVSEASSAADALARIGAETFDVMLSDVGLPAMDGLELIAALRRHEQPAIARLPAIALTAYTRAVDRTAALRAGFRAHVPKPADPEELVAVVVSVLGRP
jgi:CheY-like chemotaxis protein